MVSSRRSAAISAKNDLACAAICASAFEPVGVQYPQEAWRAPSVARSRRHQLVGDSTHRPGRRTAWNGLQQHRKVALRRMASSSSTLPVNTSRGITASAERRRLALLCHGRGPVTQDWPASVLLFGSSLRAAAGTLGIIHQLNITMHHQQRQHSLATNHRTAANNQGIEWEELPSLSRLLAQAEPAPRFAPAWANTMPATLDTLPPSAPFRETLPGLATREVREPEIFRLFFGQQLRAD